MFLGWLLEFFELSLKNLLTWLLMRVILHLFERAEVLQHVGKKVARRMQNKLTYCFKLDILRT